MLCYFSSFLYCWNLVSLNFNSVTKPYEKANLLSCNSLYHVLVPALCVYNLASYEHNGILYNAIIQLTVDYVVCLPYEHLLRKMNYDDPV